MRKVSFITVLSIILAGLIFFACTKSEKEEPRGSFTSYVKHPEWSKNIVLYEVNTRQFTPEGTFRAFTSHLPRLKELGVDVLWFMPIHPIGEINRKGELGSPYCVKDYLDVNPEFGNLDDFKTMVDEAHEMGFRIMLDWVPNHTAWDNPLAQEHPDWYLKNESGNFTPPFGFDWTDVIQLDLTNPEMQEYMINAMKLWVELGVDGFRVDHPHKTPKGFWEIVRPELDKIRPVLLMAENEDQLYFLEKGFDMNYGWELHHMVDQVAKGKENVRKIDSLFKKEFRIFPQNVYRMRFLTNHDENKEKGSIYERYPEEGYPAFAVFIFTVEGVPLIFNGQEACRDRDGRQSLDERKEKFFTKDTIDFTPCEMTGFYKELITLKKENPALWNGEFGGPMKRIKTSKDRKVFAFSREKDENTIVTFLNLSKHPVKIKPSMKDLKGDYMNVFTGEEVSLPLADSLKMDAWEYLVLVK